MDWEKFVTIPLHNIAWTSWLLSVTQFIWKQHTAIYEPLYHKMFCDWINTPFVSAGWFIHQCCIATQCQMSDFLLPVVCWQVNFTVVNTNHRRTSEELDKLLEYIFRVMWNGFLKNIWITLHHEIWEYTTPHFAST